MYVPGGEPPFLQFTQSGHVSYVSSNYLSQVLVGLTKQEVIDMIGMPNWRRITTFEIVFHYTEADRANGNGTYRKREVHFDSDARVSSVVSSTYYD